MYKTFKDAMPFLYDAQSFIDNIERTKTFDGDAGIMLPRQLEQIVSRIEKQVLPTQTLLTLGINIDNSGGWHNQITKLKTAVNGDFKREDGQGANTDGFISLSAESDSISVIPYNAKSEFTKTNLEQTKLGGRNILADLVLGHNAKYKAKIDTVGYVGEGSKTGLLNHAGFTRIASGALASAMSDEELYLKIKELLQGQNADVGNELFYADKIVTTVELARRCKTSDYKANTDLTIAQKIKKEFGVDIVATFNAKGIGAGGTDVMVAVCTKTQAVNIRIPQKLMISPIKQDGFDFSFKGMFRYGGVDISEDVGHILQGL
jgi:hypothetical protein